MIGTTISHYRIVKELGKGGMGVVYEAEDTKLDRTVALKLLAPHMLASENDRNRFYREARAAAALHHPNIATVFEIDETEDERPFIAMEFIEGQTLADLVSDGPLPLDKVITIGIQVAEALKAAHAKQIVHRDVKSANVMLTADGRAKVLDFGLAKTNASTKLTQLGSTLGTVAYMSPEQSRGEDVNHRSDLWSLGVVLYEMISGRLPFSGDYEQAVVYSILNGEPQPLTAIRTGVPMAFEQIVEKCLRKEADLRYQGAAGVIADLKALQIGVSRSGGGVSGHSIPAVSVAAVPVVSTATKKTPTWVWAVVAGAMLTGAAVAWFVKPASETPGRAPVQARIHLDGAAIDRYPRLSHDGSMLSFQGDALNRPEEGIFHLDMASNRLRFVAENGRLAPRYTPDGRWLLLSTPGGVMKVSTSDGAPVRVLGGVNRAVPVDNSSFLGHRDGTLYHVSLDGGDPMVAFVPDTARGYISLSPSAGLGDGEHFFLNLDRANTADVGLGRLSDGSYEPLLRDAHSAKYVRSGHLVFIQGDEWSGPLMARPFDVERRTFTGTAVPVLEGEINPSEFDVAPSGTLVYRQGLDVMLERRLYWYSNSGERLEALPADPRDYHSPSISPNGEQIAFVSRTETENTESVWVIDAETGDPSQLSFVQSNGPSWSSDGQFVLYNGDREGEHWNRRNLLRKAADGSGVEEHVFSEDVFGQYITMSPAGDWWAHTLEGVIVLVRTEDETQRRTIKRNSSLWNPVVSPNGQYVAFNTWENEKNELYVQEIEGDAFWPISEPSDLSTRDPRWSADGQWLYYQTDSALKRAQITYDPAFRRVRPETVMPLSRDDEYALHPAEERILIVTGPSRVQDADYVDVILNFDEYLRQIAPPDK